MNPLSPREQTLQDGLRSMKPEDKVFYVVLSDIVTQLTDLNSLLRNHFAGKEQGK